MPIESSLYYFVCLVLLLQENEKSQESEKSETKINDFRYFLLFLPCQQGNDTNY